MSCYEWIHHRQIREAAEIAIGRPQFLDAVLQAQRRNTGVVNLRPRDLAAYQRLAQRPPMRVRFREQDSEGDSSQASIWSIAAESGVGGRKIRGCVTIERNS